MSAANPWLLPEGIEEVLPPQAARLESIRRAIIDLYGSWGYELVVPPLIEYLESLLTGAGNDLDLQTFKLTDQLTGRLLGVRADMTPQVARIEAHHLKREAPVRLCYLGPVLHTRPDGFARSRSPLQVGVELYGHAGIESDVEVLCLLLETLDVAGVEDVHLDLGHVGVYRELARGAGLNPAQEQTLFDALQRKARSEIEALLADFGIGLGQRDAFAALVDLNGGPEVLDDARRVMQGTGEGVRQALDGLAAVSAAMAARLPALPLYFDLAELRGYNYQTGVVFAAFVPGHGEEIARGGRYDAVGEVFGRARPATGFSADLKTLVSLGREGDDAALRAGILAPWTDDPALRAEVSLLRASGERVIAELPGQDGAAAELGCDRILVQRAGKWVIDFIETREQKNG